MLMWIYEFVYTCMWWPEVVECLPQWLVFVIESPTKARAHQLTTELQESICLYFPML